jgi:hypothetical protein
MPRHIMHRYRAAHAKTAPAGDYAIKGPHQTSGFKFKKDTGAVGGGYTFAIGSATAGRRWGSARPARSAWPTRLIPKVIVTDRGGPSPAFRWM